VSTRTSSHPRNKNDLVRPKAFFSYYRHIRAAIWKLYKTPLAEMSSIDVRREWNDDVKSVPKFYCILYIILYNNILSHLSSIITSLSSQLRLGHLKIGGNNGRLNFLWISQNRVIFFKTFYYSIWFWVLSRLQYII